MSINSCVYQIQHERSFQSISRPFYASLNKHNGTRISGIYYDMRSASGETYVVRALIEQHPTMVSLSVCIPMTWKYYDRCLRAYTLPDLMAYQNPLPGSNILCGTSNTQPPRTIELEHH